MTDYPPEFLEKLKQVKGKRARIVVEHILEHGFITTEELETIYGYRHPPRAIRDVREQGISIESFSVKNNAGRSIAAYRFGTITETQLAQLSGRSTFPKRLKTQLLSRQQSHCAICNTQYESRYLQIDHRVPYLIAGELATDDIKLDLYMLVCASCNRAKSWSCEHCENGHTIKDSAICLTCYWAAPVDYRHVALRPLRRVELVWTDEEISTHAKLVAKAVDHSLSLQDYIKHILKSQVDEDNS
ncbi:MAG: HNH endonuclease [Chloroflexota bacterium]|nr:HNH endonuclease [Chloroflexota bacterium]